jgi:hypothetical protein
MQDSLVGLDKRKGPTLWNDWKCGSNPTRSRRSAPSFQDSQTQLYVQGFTLWS